MIFTGKDPYEAKYQFLIKKREDVGTKHFNKNFIMKISNEQEFYHISFSYSSGNVLKDFMNVYKKCTAKTYSFLIIDATVLSDNPLHFRKNVLQRT